MRKAAYSSIASTYDAARPISEDNLRLWLDLIAEKVGSRRDARFLDLGCGTGRFTTPIADRLDYWVIGADASEEMLQQARRKTNATRVRWLAVDAQFLSFIDMCLDAIFMSHLLHHTDDPLAVIKECHRILMKDAIILNRSGAIEHIRDDPEHRFFPGTLEIDEARTPSIRQVEQWFAHCGFHDVVSISVVQQTYRSAEARVMKAAQKHTSVLSLISQSSFEQGLDALRRYVAENPDDPWLLTDTITLTSGKK